MAKVVWINPTSGISGDMSIAAMVDLGVDPDQLVQILATIVPRSQFDLKLSSVLRSSLRATQVEVTVSDHQDHRALGQINSMIDSSQLTPNQKEVSKEIFHRLATVEAEIHGTSLDEVQLHEVGSLDAIVDICGFVVAVDMLGIEKIFYSAPALGSGLARSGHGKIPVPSPAVLQLLNDVAGYGGSSNFELTTPTGAAILSVMGQYCASMPEMVIHGVGYGAGKKDPSEFANVLRLVVGETIEPKLGDSEPLGHLETIVELETNLDDISGELGGHLITTLLGSGALDAFIMPVLAKKRRPGMLLTVLTRPHDVVDVTKEIFRLTGTLGVRSQSKERYVLDRSQFEIDLLGEKVSVKVGPFRAKVEFDQLVRVSKLVEIPILELERMAQVEIENYLNKSRGRFKPVKD